MTEFTFLASSAITLLADVLSRFKFDECCCSLNLLFKSSTYTTWPETFVGGQKFVFTILLAISELTELFSSYRWCPVGQGN